MTNQNTYNYSANTPGSNTTAGTPTASGSTSSGGWVSYGYDLKYLNQGALAGC